MKTLLRRPLLFTIALVAAHSFITGAIAQTNNPPAAEKPKETPASAESTKSSPEELEAKFKAMLINATMSGRWCSVKDGVMGPDKEDKYNIVGAEKISGDNWVVRARIQFGQREIVAPIPVKIKWAGDTAVLSVDNLTMPTGGGSYTARILFYDNTYSGTWSGGDHGGLLHGTISHTNN